MLVVLHAFHRLLRYRLRRSLYSIKKLDSQPTLQDQSVKEVGHFPDVSLYLCYVSQNIPPLPFLQENIRGAFSKSILKRLRIEMYLIDFIQVLSVWGAFC